MKIKRFTLAIAALFLSQEVLSNELILRAPSSSNDGSYIIQLDKPQSGKTFDELELYRSLDGGDYELLVVVPFFKAISQLVKQNGIYAYKIRGVNHNGSSEMSEAVYVEVQSSSIKLQEKSISLEKEEKELKLGVW